MSAPVTDTNGGKVSAATVIFLQPQAPIVSLTSSKTINGANTDVIFTATVTPSTTSVAQYVWTFGDGTSLTTSTATTTHSYLTTSLPKTATVEVVTTTGQTMTSSTTVF